MTIGSFVEEIKASLQLEVEGKKCEITAGHIEEIQCKLHPYGYEAQVNFSAFENEEIKALFADPKVINAHLTILSKDPKQAEPLIELKGVVNARSSQPAGEKGEKLIIRLYKIQFIDHAYISWGSHFPKKIFVDQTMKDVFDSEKNPLFTMTYEFDDLNTQRPIIAYSLEKKKGIPEEKQISFYSFVMWYLHQTNGIFEFNYKEAAYKILGKKDEGGKTLPLSEWSITPAICLFPESPRYFERVIKHSAASQDQNDTENPNGIPSVRNDAFDDTSYIEFPEQISQIVQSKSYPEKPRIRFDFSELPSDFTLDQIRPGTFFEIKGDSKRGGMWCEDPIYKDQTFRMTDVTIYFQRRTESEKRERIVQPYKVEIEVTAESKDEPAVLRPEFQEPVYPFSIPGKIWSEIGDKEQTTFNVVKNDKSPLGHYEVIVPLAGEEKKVVVPFTPDFISGQHYFPLCKEQQVMLSLYFQTAKIERILDWQPLTRLPLDTQACQIVFGSNGKDKYCIQKHEYKDGKESTLTVQQATSENQSQTIEIKDKIIVVTVKEKDKSTISVQLDRATGLTILLKDEDSGATQQTMYTPESITHTSEGKEGKSTIVQKQDSISFECKSYNIKCEDLIIDSSKTITQKASKKLFIESPIVNILGKVKMNR